MDKLTNEQIQHISELLKTQPQDQLLNNWGVIVGIIVGIGTVLALFVGLINFVRESGAREALQRKFNEDMKNSLDHAHREIREIRPIVNTNTNAIELLKKDIDYIKEGIDELREVKKGGHQ